MTIRTSRWNLICVRSQTGLRAKRRMWFPLSTWALMVCASQSGGVGCSLLGDYSEAWMVHWTLFEKLQSLKHSRDWKREVQQACILLWWRSHGGLRPSATNLTPMHGLLSMISLGSSASYQMIMTCRPSRSDAMMAKRIMTNPRVSTGMFGCFYWPYLLLMCLLAVFDSIKLLNILLQYDFICCSDPLCSSCILKLAVITYPF